MKKENNVSSWPKYRKYISGRFKLYDTCKTKTIAKDRQRYFRGNFAGLARIEHNKNREMPYAIYVSLPGRQLPK